MPVADSIDTQVLVLLLGLIWPVLVVACDDGVCLWQHMSSVAHGLYDSAHTCIVVAGIYVVL